MGVPARRPSSQEGRAQHASHPSSSCGTQARGTAKAARAVVADRPTLRPTYPYLPRVTRWSARTRSIPKRLADGALKRQPLPDRIGRVSERGHPDELCDPDPTTRSWVIARWSSPPDPDDSTSVCWSSCWRPSDCGRCDRLRHAVADVAREPTAPHPADLPPYPIPLLPSPAPCPTDAFALSHNTLSTALSGHGDMTVRASGCADMSPGGITTLATSAAPARAATRAPCGDEL